MMRLRSAKRCLIVLSSVLLIACTSVEPPAEVESASLLPAAVTPKLVEEDGIKTLFRLHGSNTVGESMAPALVKSYLRDIGANDILLIQGDVAVENEIQANIEDLGRIRVELHAHGSSTGFKDLDKGAADFAMSSRPIKSKEVELLQARYGDLTASNGEHVVALDGVAIIVHPKNPIASLTTSEVAALFAGEAESWADFGWKGKAVTVYARDGNSGTWDTFKNLVLKRHKKKLILAAQRFESSSALVQAVLADERAIGFVGLASVGKAKVLAISETKGMVAIKPRAFTVATEDYPLARRLFFYTPTNTENRYVREFIDFALSYDGQSIAEQQGLISQNLFKIKPEMSDSYPAVYRSIASKGERLSLNFRFKTGSEVLDNKSLRDVRRLASYMKERQRGDLVLLGFSDNQEDLSRDMLLSLNRAESVQRELAKHAVDIKTVLGLGALVSIASNANEVGRAKNRRVEVWVR